MPERLMRTVLVAVCTEAIEGALLVDEVLLGGFAVCCFKVLCMRS